MLFRMAIYQMTLIYWIIYDKCTDNCEMLLGKKRYACRKVQHSYNEQDPDQFAHSHRLLRTLASGPWNFAMQLFCTAEIISTVQFFFCFFFVTSCLLYGRPIPFCKRSPLYKKDSPQWAHNVKMMSYQRRCDVITSHRRWYDVILILCACWDTSVTEALEYWDLTINNAETIKYLSAFDRLCSSSFSNVLRKNGYIKRQILKTYI